MSRTGKEAPARTRLAALQDQAIARYRERQPAWRSLIAQPQSVDRTKAINALPHRSIFWGDISVQAYLPKDQGGGRRADYRFHYWLHHNRIPTARALAALTEGMQGIVELPRRAAPPRVARVARVGGASIVPFPAARRSAAPASTFRKDLEGLVASKSEADCAACELVVMLRKLLAEERAGN